MFPTPPLMPNEPHQRYRVRMCNKFIDEYLHNSCTILTFATAFRPAFLKMPRDVWLAEIDKGPLKRRAEYKRSVIEHGLDSEFVVDALAHHRKLLAWMSDSLQRAPLSRRRELLQCRLRSDPLHFAAGAPQARRAVGAVAGDR
jgi:hypothetical protein